MAGIVGLFWLVFYLRDPSGEGVNDLIWHEAVTLESGEEIRILRGAYFESHAVWGVGGQSSGPLNERYTLQIPGRDDFLLWTAPVRPMLVDKDPATGEWVIISTPVIGGAWDTNGQPCPPQWTFRLRNGVWHIETALASFFGRTSNLLTELRLSDDAKYGSTEFETVAAARKAEYHRYTPGYLHGNPYVGDTTLLPRYCDDPTPRFTRIFDPTVGGPRLDQFPRTDP